MFRSDKRKMDAICKRIERLEKGNRQFDFMPRPDHMVYVWSGNVTMPVCMHGERVR